MAAFRLIPHDLCARAGARIQQQAERILRFVRTPLSGREQPCGRLERFPNMCAPAGVLRGRRAWRTSVRGYRLLVSFALSAMLACGAALAVAQSTFGSIRGTVQDEQGAVVPGALITAQSLEENEVLTTTSGADGDFVFENMKAGHYKITVHKDGFTDCVVPSTALEARQELRLPLTLAVSAETTTVEVVAEGQLVNTENGTLNDTIRNEDITQLPINTRSVSSSPLGALAVSPEVTRDSQGDIAVGGATAAQTGFSVDGIPTANIR